MAPVEVSRDPGSLSASSVRKAADALRMMFGMFTLTSSFAANTWERLVAKASETLAGRSSMYLELPRS